MKLSSGLSLGNFLKVETSGPRLFAVLESCLEVQTHTGSLSRVSSGMFDSLMLCLLACSSQTNLGVSQTTQINSLFENHRTAVLQYISQLLTLGLEADPCAH